MVAVSDSPAGRKTDLPLLTFSDLKAQGLVQTWTSVNRWIDERGFPPGRMIGKHRFWTQAEVMRWVEARPTSKAELRGAAKKLHAAANNGGAA